MNPICDTSPPEKPRLSGLAYVQAIRTGAEPNPEPIVRDRLAIIADGIVQEFFDNRRVTARDRFLNEGWQISGKGDMYKRTIDYSVTVFRSDDGWKCEVFNSQWPKIKYLMQAVESVEQAKDLAWQFLCHLGVLSAG